jgi:GntR family transcriptional regulator
MLPFSIALRSGEPIHPQVVYAVRRAVVTGQLQAGDAFPSVRALSVALKINPNTAHKIVATLIEDGLLTAQSGIGTVVAVYRAAGSAARRAVLEDDAERLVVESRRSGVTFKELVDAIRRHWSGTVDREE